MTNHIMNSYWDVFVGRSTNQESPVSTCSKPLPESVSFVSMVGSWTFGAKVEKGAQNPNNERLAPGIFHINQEQAMENSMVDNKLYHSWLISINGHHGW